MRRHRHMLVIPAAVVVGLSSCASSPEPDWQAAQSRADAFIETASTSADFLGADSFHIKQNAEVPFDERGATLTYPAEIRVDDISAACFGGGEASFGVTVRTGSAWTGVDSITLTCDSEARTMPLAAPLERINAIKLTGGVEKGAGAVVAAIITGVAE